MTGEQTTATANPSGTTTVATANPITSLFVVASALIGIGLVIDLITWSTWDRGGWTDSDGQLVDAGPFPWAGIVIAAIPTFIGLVMLATAIIAKGVQLGLRPDSGEQDV